MLNQFIKSKLIKKNNIGFIIFFVVCILFTFYLAFYNLGKAPFDNWDEAWYADVTRNILQNKEFIVLYWNHDIWLDKPPLYMWLSAAISSVIGLSEFSMRLVSAVSGVITILLVVWYSHKNYGLLPSILAFSAIALNNIFVWRMRSGNLDIFVSLLIFLTFLVLISKNKYKYLILGFLFATIYLAKTSLVFYPLSIFVIHEVIFNRDKWKILYKEYIKLFLITAIIPSLWLLLGYIKVGSAFPLYFLFSSDQNVSNMSLENLNSNYIFHAYYSLQRRFFFVFIIGILFAFKNIKDSKTFLLILYSISLLILLSFTQRDNNWYLIPSMPFWSILVAYGTYKVIKIFKKNLIIISIIVILTLIVSYKTFTINILPIINNSSVVKLSESAKVLNKITNENDIVVRLDHLYPTTIYYSDREVKVSPLETENSVRRWITRADLIKEINSKNINWIVGKNEDIEKFKLNLESKNLEIIKVNDEETILHIE